MNRLRYSDEVAAARAERAPIVALETTILSHGMPYPRNLETALRVEAAVRTEGAVPATIAIDGGAIHVGCDAELLERFARGTDVRKVSRADLGAVLASGASGATTVAATMICAHAANIEVFATGGIGGVHRGGESTMDVSADLTELARTPVIVVCAGVKAILDIPRTLEVLETYGVPAVAVGQDAFPAFWSRESGVRAPLRLDDPESIARAAAAGRALGLRAGMLVALPIAREHEIPREQIEPLVRRALDEAAAVGIEGKATTPWLLERVRLLSGDRSLESNAALIEANARFAARIAIRATGLDAARTRAD